MFFWRGFPIVCDNPGCYSKDRSTHSSSLWFRHASSYKINLVLSRWQSRLALNYIRVQWCIRQFSVYIGFLTTHGLRLGGSKSDHFSKNHQIHFKRLSFHEYLMGCNVFTTVEQGLTSSFDIWCPNITDNDRNIFILSSKMYTSIIKYNKFSSNWNLSENSTKHAATSSKLKVSESMESQLSRGVFGTNNGWKLVAPQHLKEPNEFDDFLKIDSKSSISGIT